MTPEELKRAEEAARHGRGLIVVTPTQDQIPEDLRHLVPKKLLLFDEAPEPEQFRQEYLAEFMALEDMQTGQLHTYFGKVSDRKLGEFPSENEWSPPLRHIPGRTAAPQTFPPKEPDIKNNPDGTISIKRKPYELEFFAYETQPGEILDLGPLHDKLAARDDVQRYAEDSPAFGGLHYGAAFQRQPDCGYTTIEVLPFLKGQPLNNLALAYIQALRPSHLRISHGEVHTDAMTWRVTVFLRMPEVVKTGRAVSKSTALTTPTVEVIDRIEQEVEIGYGCGADVEEFLRHQKQGTRPSARRTAGACIGNTKGLERVDFS